MACELYLHKNIFFKKKVWPALLTWRWEHENLSRSMIKKSLPIILVLLTAVPFPVGRVYISTLLNLGVVIWLALNKEIEAEVTPSKSFKEHVHGSPSLPFPSAMETQMAGAAISHIPLALLYATLSWELSLATGICYVRTLSRLEVPGN